jgi:hypothetical protein
LQLFSQKQICPPCPAPLPGKWLLSSWSTAYFNKISKINDQFDLERNGPFKGFFSEVQAFLRVTKMLKPFCVKRKNLTTEGDKRFLCINKLLDF